MMISFTLFSMDAVSTLKAFQKYKTEKDMTNQALLEFEPEYILFYRHYKGCLKEICIHE